MDNYGCNTPLWVQYSAQRRKEPQSSPTESRRALRLFDASLSEGIPYSASD